MYILSYFDWGCVMGCVALISAGLWFYFHEASKR